MDNNILIALDIDDTLVPFDHQFLDLEKIQKIGKIIKNIPNCVFGYPTGRVFFQTIRAFKKYSLPPADFLICSNGASVFFNDVEKWIEDLEYENFLIKQNPDFNREKIAKNLTNIFSFLQEAEEERQNKMRIVFLVDPEKDLQEAMKEINQLLLSKNILNTRLVPAFDFNNRTGIIDILPNKVSKLSSLQYIAKKFDIAEENIIFAGDGVNDFEIFTSDIKSIVVGNAEEELKQKIKEADSKNTYFAKENFVDGVVEGLRYFGIVLTTNDDGADTRVMPLQDK